MSYWPFTTGDLVDQYIVLDACIHETMSMSMLGGPFSSTYCVVTGVVQCRNGLRHETTQRLIDLQTPEAISISLCNDISIRTRGPLTFQLRNKAT